MDQQKLSEIVTKEAKQEAEKIVKIAMESSENDINTEKESIRRHYDERMASENNQFLSRLNYLRFNMESEYKKKLLYLKHQLMEELKTFLFEAALEQIVCDPSNYLAMVLKDCPSIQGTVYSGNKIASILDENIIQQYNQNHQSSFRWGGIDLTMEAGLSVEKGTVKYIFPLVEWIDRFVEEQKNEINDKYYS